MGKIKVMIMAAVAVLWVGVCCGWGEEAKERKNLKAKGANAKNRVDHGLIGFTPSTQASGSNPSTVNAKERAQEMMHKAGDVASRAIENELWCIW
ncbi:hypothetical protein SLEP1_g12057 [Rubroshorea leprosula]|nr:hypothetical protein SLEP1_g12057 [Rubroshorea leprosula]